jgi:hypothetical protein
MSDTFRNESIGYEKTWEELYLRLAHFQGGRLELLHIRVPLYKSATDQHSRRGIGGAIVKFGARRIPVARKDSAHDDSCQEE